MAQRPESTQWSAKLEWCLDTFTSRLKATSAVAARMDDAKLSLSRGAATWNVRSPEIDRQLEYRCHCGLAKMTTTIDVSYSTDALSEVGRSCAVKTTVRGHRGGTVSALRPTTAILTYYSLTNIDIYIYTTINFTRLSVTTEVGGRIIWATYYIYTVSQKVPPLQLAIIFTYTVRL